MQIFVNGERNTMMLDVTPTEKMREARNVPSRMMCGADDSS